MQMLEEFKQLYEWYKKKYKTQSSFKTLKMAKGPSGEKEPVFYIGVPGLSVAIVLSVFTIATVYVLYLPFYWSVWIPYILLIMVTFRAAMKLDKAKQIRHMVFYQMDMAYKLLEKVSETEDSTEKEKYTSKALEWLERADKWVDEPGLKAQIDVLKNI